MKRLVSAVLATLLIPLGWASLPAQASGAVTYDFESGTAGWTAFNDFVNLGVTELAGCVAQDTSDYSALRWYDFWAEEESDWDFSPGLAMSRQDNDFFTYSMANHLFEEEPELSASAGIFDNTSGEAGLVVDADPSDPSDSGDFVPANNASKYLHLASLSYLDDSYEPESGVFPGQGYVLHGPAVWSPSVELAAGETVRFDWAADGVDDDYKAFGYLLNVDSCDQLELIDETGIGSQWQTVAAEVPTAGTYVFVFVAGTFDASFGGAAGGNLFIDNVTLGSASSAEPTPVPYLGPVVTNDPETATSGGTVTYTGSDLDDVTSATIAGQAATIVSKSPSTLTLRVPTGLALGQHDVDLHYNTTEVLTLQNGLVIQDPMKVWTQLQSDNTVKMYAKNIIGEGKIQFFHNGNEIAWVRASNALNPKLREANGSHYLVRTRELVAGKNAFEIYQDGMRIWRAAYTG